MPEPREHPQPDALQPLPGPRRAWNARSALVLIITLSLPFVCCVGLDTAFRPEPLPTPAGSTLLSQLFLTSADFPNDRWTPDPNGPGRACISAPLGSGCESAEARQLFFHGPTGHAFQTIHVYYSRQDAAADFQRVVSLELQNGHPMRTDWSQPSEWDSLGSSADEAVFKCRIPWPGLPRQCEFIGRYDEFIVIFFSSVDALDLSQFEQVLDAIDARMSASLPHDHNPPAPDQYMGTSDRRLTSMKALPLSRLTYRNQKPPRS